MVYLYNTCDQISDFCHQQILRKIGKTVYPLPLQGAGIKILACEFQLQYLKFYKSQSLAQQYNPWDRSHLLTWKVFFYEHDKFPSQMAQFTKTAVPVVSGIQYPYALQHDTISSSLVFNRLMLFMLFKFGIVISGQMST